MTDPYVLGPPPDYRPLRGEPNDLIPPEERAAIYARGSMLVREVLATTRMSHAEDASPDACPQHPDQRGGTTPAGDPYCPDCRRAGRGQTTTKESDR